MPLLCLFLCFLAQIQVMEFKFLPKIAIMVPMFPVPNEAPPRWVKLNKSPACVGANGDYFGRFSYPKNIFVSSFMLVHRSGTVTCDKKGYSYWGCALDVNLFSVLLTDQNNNILALDATPPVGKGGWYHLAGSGADYSSSSSVLVFCAKKKPQCVFANRELRLWYGEDLRAPDSESDNGGKTCADVHGQPA